MERFWFGVTALLVAVLVFILLASTALSAPAPFPRAIAKRGPIRQRELVGVWTSTWGVVPCTITLLASGRYECAWPGDHYIGTWGLERDGSFRLTENRSQSRPHWEDYTVRFAREPSGFAGPVLVGAAGVTVRLRRKP